MSYFAKNIEILKRYHSQVYENISGKCDADIAQYEIVPTKSGHVTVKIENYFLHSKYNPLQEASTFVESKIDTTILKHVIMYGFGFGYHVEEMLRRIHPEQKLYLFELNVSLFMLALHERDLQDVLTHKQVSLFVSDDQRAIAQALSLLLAKPNQFLIYGPAARAIPQKHEYFRFLLENWDKRLRQVEKHAPLLTGNYEANRKRHDPGIKELFGSYPNRPIFVISSGPSLNKNKRLLAGCKGKALLFAAGSALKPLVREGVIPDLFCIIDPIHETTIKQIEGYENLGIPLVYLDTASAKTVAAYRGPHFVASNTKAHVQNEDEIIETGGSVATAVLDIALRMGGNPIIFVGQDLAFTNNEHHADGSMYGESPEVKINPTMKWIKGQHGEMLPTSIGLLGYKYWIEQRIKREPNVTFINATEGGAFIEGCQHLSLAETIRMYVNI
ncbi:motility associated factor glycosyltransferase family protein [Aneurinibacillus danicus]|uniref:Motility accessory factor Maf-2 n=1 Tax=Aneurinibacillus danicus TaxID=267746 RepID=A0A511V7W9_9BACL|nr:6-hydroxymethylpterin diphosphokinase MptE-like protein [Aneurinibacillus danicus]GEN35035.1 hypothetical protein ADA01nite_24950 [Aneurinibacillus danicus]